MKVELWSKKFWFEHRVYKVNRPTFRTSSCSRKKVGRLALLWPIPNYELHAWFVNHANITFSSPMKKMLWQLNIFIVNAWISCFMGGCSNIFQTASFKIPQWKFDGLDCDVQDHGKRDREGRKKGRKKGRKEGRKEEGVAPLLKSRDPHWE